MVKPNTDNILIPTSDENRKSHVGVDSNFILDQVVEMEEKYQPQQKCGGSGEIVQNEETFDMILQKMRSAEFHNIRDSHRRREQFPEKRGLAEKLGGSLHRNVHESETVDGVRVCQMPQNSDILEEYRIHTTDNTYRHQLETNIRNTLHRTRSPPVLVGEILCSLGKGSDAECFLSYDPITKRNIVHKKYDGKARERERDALEKLRHRSIPAFYGSIVEEGRHILRMEYCGQSLRQWKKNTQVTEAGLWSITEQLTDVLSYLDYHKVIHRDIKPDNVCIQVTSTGLMVKLIDFGSVQILQDNVCPGGRLTAAYMAPEMWLMYYCRGPPASSKADVFSCGLTLCFLMYDVDVVPQAMGTNDGNQMPWKMIKEPSLIADYVEKTFPLESPSLKKLLLKMLQGCPQRRISAAEAHREIATHCMQPVYDTLDAEEIKEQLGIDIVNHDVILSYSEAIPASRKVYQVPDDLRPDGQIHAWTPCSIAVIDRQISHAFTAPHTLGLATSDDLKYKPDLQKELRLPLQEQTKPPLLCETESIETTVTSQTNYQGDLRNEINTTLPPSDYASPDINQSADNIAIDPSTNCHGLVTVNQDAGVTAELKSNQQILNQEKLHQPLGDGNNQNSSMTNGTNLKWGVGKDYQEDMNTACVDKPPDRQANQEVLGKLKNRLKIGARKRASPVLPSEYTNLPYLDQILCKRKKIG